MVGRWQWAAGLEPRPRSGRFGRAVAVLLAFVLALTAGFADTAAAKRVALVVANGAYQVASRLDNPTNDARVVGAALSRVGFEVVPAPEVGIAAFRAALKEFRTRAEGAEVALVYYAGHGIEGKGENWLIPVDAKLDSEQDLADEAINLERVLDAVKGAELRVVILDACRNNPFGRQWRAGTRSLARGLAGLEIDDILVIYAAAPGQVALDGTGGNSPFATALSRRLVEPGLPVQILGNAVRDDVLAATGGQQRPFVSSSISAQLRYLAGAAPSGATVAAPNVTAPGVAAPTVVVPGGGLRPVSPVLVKLAGNMSDANTRQARQRLRERLAGLPGTPLKVVWLSGEASLLFQLDIDIQRSETIGERRVDLSLRVTCRPAAASATCPAPRWTARAVGAGPSYDAAERTAIDQAVEQVALAMAPNFGRAGP